MSVQLSEEELTNKKQGMSEKGFLLKRKDFLGVDSNANSHPNRTYYYKRFHDLDGVIETCTKKLQVRVFGHSLA